MFSFFLLLFVVGLSEFVASAPISIGLGFARNERLSKAARDVIMLPPPPANVSSTTASSSEISGTIDVTIPSNALSLNDSTTQRIGSLVIVPDVSELAYKFDVSDNVAPAFFTIHTEPSAPLIPGKPSWAPVTLRPSMNSSDVKLDECAEFIAGGVGSSSPIVVRPCVPGWDISSTTSQIFVVDYVTMHIMPLWSAVINNSTSTVSTTANYVATSDAAAAPLTPATLVFRPNSNSDQDSLAVDSSSDDSSDDVDTSDDVLDGTYDDAETGDNHTDQDSFNVNAADDDDPAVEEDPTPDPPPPDDEASVAGPAGGYYGANEAEAIALNAQFSTMTSDSACTQGDLACIGDAFAQCDHGAWVLTTCGPGTVCRALPTWSGPGTSVTCDTVQDANLRLSLAASASASG